MNTKIGSALVSILLGIIGPTATTFTFAYDYESHEYFRSEGNPATGEYSITKSRTVEREIYEGDGSDFYQVRQRPQTRARASYVDQVPPDAAEDYADYETPAPLSQNYQPDYSQDDTGYSDAPAPPATYSYGYSPYYVAPAYPSYYYPSVSIGLGWGGYWNNWGPYYGGRYWGRNYWNGGYHGGGRYWGGYGHGGNWNRGHGGDWGHNRGGNWGGGRGAGYQGGHQSGMGGRSSGGSRSFNSAPRSGGGSAPRQGGFQGRSGGGGGGSRGGGGGRR